MGQYKNICFLAGRVLLGYFFTFWKRAGLGFKLLQLLQIMHPSPIKFWSFEFSGRKMRCVVTRDAIQYEPDRNIPITGTQQYAYDGETFERLRDTFNGTVLSRRSEIVDDPSDDPRFWGWNLSGGEKSLIMLIDELEVESIKSAKWVTTVTDARTGTKTDVTTTTMQFTNIRINEPIPESRFSVEPPPGATVFDMRTQESFEVPAEKNK